jgi:hypothetical protein
VCHVAVPALVMIIGVPAAAACSRRMAAAIGERQMLPKQTQLTRIGRTGAWASSEAGITGRLARVVMRASDSPRRHALGFAA